MTTLSFEDVARSVSTLPMTNEQIRELGERLKRRRELITDDVRLSFRRGDRVQWDKKGGRHAGVHTGTVEKIGPKNITVREDATNGHGTGGMSYGLKWTCHPATLTKITA